MVGVEQEATEITEISVTNFQPYGMLPLSVSSVSSCEKRDSVLRELTRMFANLVAQTFLSAGERDIPVPWFRFRTLDVATGKSRPPADKNVCAT